LCAGEIKKLATGKIVELCSGGGDKTALQAAAPTQRGLRIGLIPLAFLVPSPGWTGALARAGEAGKRQEASQELRVGVGLAWAS